MKNTKIPRISPARRLLYAFLGLLAGDLILLFFFSNMPSMPPYSRANLPLRFQTQFRPSSSTRSSHLSAGCS